MTPEQRAEARSRAYALLAGLWMEGLTADRLAVVRHTPLAASLPEAADLDQLAAAHHHAWTLEVLPYAGVFLDTDATVGGAAQRLLTDCRAAGFSPRTEATRADHLGITLAALSFLCGAEADALVDGKDEIAAQVVALQQALLRQHAVSWLPPLWAAAQRAVGGFWGAVMSLTAETLLDQYQGGQGGWPLEPVPADLLDNPKTSLWRIAGLLATPAQSGVFLTREDLSRVGRAVGVPRGFGARQQMLANLLRNAAEYQELPALVAQLDAVWAERAAAYAALGEQHPVLSEQAGCWRQQAERTRQTLQRLAEQARRMS